jgi:hypothetical protein
MALFSLSPVLPDVSRILPASTGQSHPLRRRSVGLKMPDFAPYDAALARGWTMLRRRSEQ